MGSASTKERAATVWASLCWNPHGSPWGDAGEPLTPASWPQVEGDSAGATSATYSSRGRVLTTRDDGVELNKAVSVPCTSMLGPLSHRSSGPPFCADTVAVATGAPTGAAAHGPPQPLVALLPLYTLKAVLVELGMMRTADDVVPPGTFTAPEAAVAMRAPPLFSVMATSTLPP